MLNSPYGPKDVRRVSFQRLPKAIREAGISMIERKLATGTITDLVTISDSEWHQVCRCFNAIQRLAEHPGRLGRSAKEIASMFGASDRTGRLSASFIAVISNHNNNDGSVSARTS
jgi:hypothetical protein